MLANSYSFLPLVRSSEGKPEPSKGWKIVSDASVARFLGSERAGEARIKQLAKTLQEAIADPSFVCVPALVISENAQIGEALDNLEKQSVMLVKHRDRDRHDLVGILTAFDLL
jgi:hypothetical protein